MQVSVDGLGKKLHKLLLEHGSMKNVDTVIARVTKQDRNTLIPIACSRKILRLLVVGGSQKVNWPYYLAGLSRMLRYILFMIEFINRYRCIL